MRVQGRLPGGGDPPALHLGGRASEKEPVSWRAGGGLAQWVRAGLTSQGHPGPNPAPSLGGCDSGTPLTSSALSADLQQTRNI